MTYFVFRNYTIELFFKEFRASFSGYEDITSIDNKADSYIWFYLVPYSTNSAFVTSKINDYCNLLDLTLLKTDASKQFLIFTMESIYKINYQTGDRDISEAIANYNDKIYDFANSNNNIKIVNIHDFYQHFSGDKLVDWKYYYLSQIPINPKLSSDFTVWFSRQLDVVALKRKKCIVLDLDNTIWGGVLGEDGIDNIKMGEDYPGNAYRFFQSWLVQLERFGVILTICSKNNEEDVLNVWARHPDIVLRKELIVAYRINWNNKADNIKELAQQLNIGLDSMVFIDDSPAERELIKQLLPQVCVPEFPDQPYLLANFIKRLSDDYFSIYAVTSEDINKTKLYKENVERDNFKNKFDNFDLYIKSLEIVLTIEKLNNFNITRFAQMTKKTNQFNLTTYRYTESDIQSFADKGNLVYGLRVKDRFGDNGITGLIMVEMDKESAKINTYLLSCRILGREIEYTFINYMLNKLKDCSINKVHAVFIATQKNKQVENFYDTVGFKVVKTSDDGKEYELSLDNNNLLLTDLHKVEEICREE
jgi:FkbH-like protein